MSIEMLLTKEDEVGRKTRDICLAGPQVDDRESFERLVGVSQEMQRVHGWIRRLKEGFATALILGEEGTGKELVARAIHARSRSGEGDFVAINCGLLTESMLENELFGHEGMGLAGAIEQAEGGTLFLERIKELSPALQQRLLLAIHDRVVIPVDGTEPIQVDFRLIAATNVDLRERMKLGKFRSDLFHRLSLFLINLPPLREREADISLLTSHFLATYAQDVECRSPEITPEVIILIQAYPWPGNVRELEDTILQALVMSSKDRISVDKAIARLVTNLIVLWNVRH